MNKQVASPVSGEDRISALPNDIICNILSYLHVDESARTSILSKRWRNMWLLSPISISDESIVKQSLIYCFIQEESSSWIVNAISHIISTHPGPIHICHFSLPDWGEYHETLVNTLKTLTLEGIRSLRINLRYFKIPCFVFECDSLVDVHLWGGSLPDHLPAHTGTFRDLRKLTLIYSFIKVEFLVNLLSSSSIIELALFGCYLLGDFVIESGSLRKFHTKDNSERGVFNLTVKDAPNLESFKCEDLPRYCKVLILNAPKLRVLSRIDMETSILQLGNYQFDHYDNYVKIIGEITYMPSLRSLDIAVDFGRLDEPNLVLHLLVCFPNLETLEVFMKGEFCTYYEYYGNLNSVVSANNAAATVVDGDYDDHVCLISNINCLNHHLKNARLTNYYGRRAHMDFARLVVANAKVL